MSKKNATTGEYSNSPERQTFPIRAKVAMVSDDLREVVLIRYEDGHLGFPGGHFEQDDSDPRDTAIREVAEETGVIGIEPIHFGMWLKKSRDHPDKQLVIGYGVVMPRHDLSESEEGMPLWIKIEEIRSGNIKIDEQYKSLINDTVNYAKSESVSRSIKISAGDVGQLALLMTQSDHPLQSE